MQTRIRGGNPPDDICHHTVCGRMGNSARLKQTSIPFAAHYAPRKPRNNTAETSRGRARECESRAPPTVCGRCRICAVHTRKQTVAKCPTTPPPDLTTPGTGPRKAMRPIAPNERSWRCYALAWATPLASRMPFSPPKTCFQLPQIR